MGYEQTTLRAFIFVGVGNEKCIADYVAQLLPSLLFSLTANNFATKWGAEAVRDTDKRPLDTERKEPDKNASNFE